MKVAIVHPWFLETGGGEKVADVFAEMYPNADIFALSVDSTILPPHIRGKKIYTSGLNKILASFFRFKKTHVMPLYPWAVESLDVSKYDLILSSCGPAVMGINASQNAVHIAYIHSPQVTWWHLYATRQSQLHWISRQLFVLFASFIRVWEFNAMQRVDCVVSNSNYIANRVHKYFRRESTVIYPPVNTTIGYLASKHDDYYFSVSRLAVDKRLDILILACSQLKRRLIIGGVGKEEKRLKALAGPTIEFIGQVPDQDLPALYAHSRALLFAADEDFGIVPVEAQSFGRPVIAYGHGGSLETVRVNDSVGRSDTGVFFPDQTVESLVDGILRFESKEDKFIPAEIQQHAQQFDTSIFMKKMRKCIDAAMEK